MSEAVLRVVRGEPTAEELAAITAVVSAAAGKAEKTLPPHRRWNDPSYGLRRPLHPGPGAWRAALR